MIVIIYWQKAKVQLQYITLIHNSQLDKKFITETRKEEDEKIFKIIEEIIVCFYTIKTKINNTLVMLQK